MAKTTLEERIKKIIHKNYGDQLWAFRDDVEYDEAVDGFVKVLAKVIRGATIDCKNGNYNEGLRVKKAGPLERTIMTRVRKLRESKGVSQDELSSKMQTHPDYLKEVESGDMVVFVTTLVDALTLLGATKEEKREVVKNIGA